MIYKHAIQTVAFAGLLLATPASAKHYEGVLNGIITSGLTTNVFGDLDRKDITGTPIQMIFSLNYNTGYGNQQIAMDYLNFYFNTITIKTNDANHKVLFDYTLDSSNGSYYFANYQYSGDLSSGDYYSGVADDPLFNLIDFRFRGGKPYLGKMSGYIHATSDVRDSSIPQEFVTQFSARIEEGFITGTAAPEPATWALMISGFGLVGVAMRKQYKSAVPA